MTLHDDELPIDLALVRRLVDGLPEYAGRPLVPLATSGSTNTLVRLGDDLLVRLPRQPGGSVTIDKEHRWLPVLAPALPTDVPEIVAVCEPTGGYPERWSVVRWTDGATPAAGTGGEALGRELAAVVVALRDAPVPAEARTDPALRWYRGGPLAALDEDTRANLEACAAIRGLDLDLAAARRVWDEAPRLPAPSRSEHWLHGDLFAENLLVDQGHLAAVLDFGGLAVGDPTVDLAGAWEVLDADGRAAFRAAVDDLDDATWLRGRAWALAIALLTFPYYWDTMPDRCADRLVAANAVLADAE